MYAGEIENARAMAMSESGTLFVGTQSANKVFALKDCDGDGMAEEVHIIASNLSRPNGVALRNGSLYVGEVSQILRYDNIEDDLNNPLEPVVVYDDLPTETYHGRKFIAFGPDDKLYVPIGSPCNVCEPGEPFGSIWRMDADGANAEMYVQGVRNSFGMDWHPDTGELWFTDNGRDRLGDDVPSDELNRVTAQGQHFGYPYIPQGDLPDPEFGVGRSADEFVAPAQKLGPHVASLGFEFYEGSSFPPEYHGQIFIAEHGSWNRSEKIGYRVSLVRLGADGSAVSYETFADGWVQNEEYWGRPVDIEQMSDGSLLVSDDTNNAIYRISYVGS
jgi:glucose/arabinose dehydrogenase